MPTIKIGWSGPLTGPSAALGLDSVEAAKIAVSEANAKGGVAGRKLELLIEDDQYDSEKAVSAYTKLAARDAIAILATTYGGVFATAGKAMSDGVLVINILDCNEEIAALPENILCIATQSESIGRAIAEDISQKGLKPTAVLYDENNPFMVLVESVIRETLAHSDGYSGGVARSEPDFEVHLTEAKDAEAFVFLGHDSMGRAMREARAMGSKAQFYAVGTITSPEFQRLAGSAANGARVAYWQAPRGPSYDAFLRAFKKRVGRAPRHELATIPTYDATKILIRAIDVALSEEQNVQSAPAESLETTRNDAHEERRIDLEALKNALYQTEEYPGVSGTITIDADGAVRTLQEEIFVYHKGRLTRKRD